MKTLINFINENVDKSFDQFNIKTYYPKDNSDDLQFIKINKNTIFNFLDKGYQYAKLGNYRGCANPRALAKNANVIKIGYDFNGEIIAVSVYTGYQEGKKCVGIIATVDRDLRDLGILALKEIIKDDIKCEHEYYWTMCSDAIEYLWNKFGGTQIPNIFVNDYLGIKKYELANDEFHFYIDVDGEKYKKTIFGYNSKETYDKVSNYIKNEINNDIQNISEALNIQNKDKIISAAKSYSKNLGAYIELIDMKGWYELPIECIEELKEMINSVELTLKKINKNEYIYKHLNNNLNSCKEILSIVQPLEINKIKI